MNTQSIIEKEYLDQATQHFVRLKSATSNHYDFASQAEYREIRRILLKADPYTQIAFILMTLAIVAKLHTSGVVSTGPNFRHEMEYPRAAVSIVCYLLRLDLPFSEKQLVFIIHRTAELGQICTHCVPHLEGVVRCTEHTFPNRPVSSEMFTALEELEKALVWIGNVPERKLYNRIQKLRGCSDGCIFNIVDAWVREIWEWVTRQSITKHKAWLDLLDWARQIKQVSPNKAWLETARGYLKTVGQRKFTERMIEWFPKVSIITLEGLSDENIVTIQECIRHYGGPDLVQQLIALRQSAASRGEYVRYYDITLKYLEFVFSDDERAQDIKDYKQRLIDAVLTFRKHPIRFTDRNNDALKGLVWYCSLAPSAEISRALGRLCEVCFKKLPGIGPLAPKVGNACINVLAETGTEDSLAQLGRLRYTIRLKSAQKIIGKAFDKAAGRMGVGRDELEEMSVPGYGLTEVGILRETMGDFTAELTADSTGTELRWIRAGGKPSTAVPAAIKRDFAEEVKELKATAKDIARMLPAQRQRVECLYLQKRSWSYPVWRQRYLDHPLVGILARKLIWALEEDGKTREAMFCDGKLVDVDGEPIEGASDKTIVRLWHPIGHDPDAIFAWRTFLETRQIRQPFKQAHREIYVLTAAERQTRVYSNRFAAHIVKQHQFNALCGVRGWSNTLKLLVDQEFPPPLIVLPAWGLRAEFWTDGLGHEYGEDTNETGTFKYLTTDQVRFLRMDARQARGHAYGRGQVTGDDPVPLAEIPPLVLSEVMRDIDLFVGVASVGNDPSWGDSGPEGHRDYWQHYAFGELGQQAQTRREALVNLIPRLKIAERCRFEERFLVVRGDLRTYKIHLGSGNILMEPDDQYLCIVRHSSKEVESGAGKVFLPFEGDLTLAEIISKAVMLAADTRITDETILSQIRRSRA